MSGSSGSSRRAFLYSAGLLVACAVGFVAGRGINSRTDRISAADASPTSSVEANLLADDAQPRPLIGIASLNSSNYVRAVRDAGGIPVVLPNTDGSTDRIDEYLDVLDGLLMPGGADIPPSEYGEERHESVEVLDDERFQFERALSKAWIEQTDKPMLGICLGSQWINVSSGGSLVQDIPTEYGVNHRGVTHPVELKEQTRLREILGEPELVVNSSHHQAVKDLGKNLKIAACSPDGVIEATETTDPDRFLIGVQWHPERLLQDDPRQENLLKAFVNASAGQEEAATLQAQ